MVSVRSWAVRRAVEGVAVGDMRNSSGDSLQERFVTQREAEVLAAIRQRLPNAEIADQLSISVRTVESHVSSLLAKFGVSSRATLVTMAEELGRSWLDELEPPTGLLRLADAGTCVGRAEQLRSLTSCWVLAKAGTPQVAFVTGEAGIGKTRLAAEFARSVLADGTIVMFGRCDEDRQGPFEAFGDAMAPYVTACPPERLHADVAELLGDLSRIMPSIGSRLPRQLGALESDANVARMRLFEAVRRLLQGAAEVGPLLLILDDLHWAPHSTLNLLKFLLRGKLRGPVMVLGTYRDTLQAPGLAAFVADVQRDSAHSQLTLKGLSQFDVGELVRQAGTTSGEAREALAVEIFGETKGNPFFTVEVIRNLHESGGGLHSDGSPDVPVGVQEVITDRANRLTEEALRVLRIAAVLGQEFDLSLLQVVSGITEDTLVECVEEAQAANLIIDVTDVSNLLGSERYSFAHAIVRRTVLNSLSPVRRRRLHATAARAIENRNPDSLEELADEIARHLVEAGQITDPRQTLRYLTMAGRAALNTAAPEEALRFFKRADALLGHADIADAIELTFQRGLAERSMGRWMDAVGSWRESLRLAAGTKDSALIARTCAAANHNIVFALRTSEALQLTEEALGLLGPEITPERGRLLGARSFASAWAGDYKTCTTSIDEELAIATALGDEALRAHGLAMKTLCHTAFLEHRAAVEHCAEAAETLRLVDDTWTLSGMLGFLSYALVGLGRFSEARAAGLELTTLSERVGNYAALQQWARMHAMMDFFERGDLDALEQFALSDLEFCRSVGVGVRDHSLGWLGLAKFLAGQWDEAESYFEAAHAAEPETAMVGWAWSSLYEFHAYAGHATVADRLLREHQDNLPTLGQANTCGSWTMALAAAEGLAVLGDFEASAAMLPVIEDCIVRTGVICVEFRGGRILARAAGVAAAAGADWRKAEQFFALARKQAEEMPHIVELAHTLRLHGSMLYETSGREDHSRADALLKESAGIYQRLKMPRHATMCLDRLTAGQLGHA